MWESENNAALAAWKSKLAVAQAWLVIAYAASLSLPITLPWIVLTIGLVVWAAQLAVDFQLKRVKFSMPPLTVPIGALALVYFISGAVNGGLREALASVGVMRTFLVYFWAWFVFKDQPQIKAKVLPSFLVAGAIAGLAAVVEHQMHLHISSYAYLQGTGFLSGPMAFAGVMQMCSLVALALAISGSYKYCCAPFSDKRLFFALVSANFLGLLFAFERSAWLGFAIGASLIAALVSWKYLLRVALVGFVIAVVGWVTLPAVQARMGAVMRGEQEESSKQRMKVWLSAIDQFNRSTKSQIIGVGPRKFEPIKIPGPNKEALDHAHSNYLQSLATTGVIGLFVYLWLCLATITLAWRALRLPRSSNLLDRGVSLGILGSIVSLLVAGIFEYNFGTGSVRLAQWFLLALLSLERRAEQPN